MRMSKIILAERDGLELKRKRIERPLGYFIKQKKRIDMEGMEPV